MKIFSDLSCFRPNPLLESGGRSRFFLKRHRKYVRSYDLLPHPEEPQPLAAAVLYDVHLLETAHYWRCNANFLSVEYIQEGNLAIRKDQHGFLAEAGEVVLLQPGADNEFVTGPAGYCIKSSIALYGSLLSAILNANELTGIDVLEKVDRHRLEQLLQQFREQAQQTESDPRNRNELLCYELLQFLRKPEPKVNIPPKMQQLYAYLENHFAENVTVEDMAAVCHYSKAFLNREFFRVFRQTPHQALTQLRLRYAEKLLRTDEDRLVKEIAMLCGYADPLNFSTAFRKQYGVSPKAYRLGAPFFHGIN